MKLSDCYEEDGHPIKCSICGAPYEMLDCRTTDTMEHIIMEQEWRCMVCNNVIALWWCGHFNPIFGYGEWE